VTPVSNLPWNGFTLEAKAFPNPVEANAYSVELKLPQSEKVTIDLYNVLGQHITTVHDKFMIKGTHRITIQNTVSKGQYYLQLKSGTHTKTIQVTIQ
ncbi:MAG: T9SS type A sorting domain-containing protein, partial [Flavisolibacter sp.]